MWARNTTPTRDPNAITKVLINLESFYDKELIFMNRHKLPDAISVHDVDLDHDSYAYEKVHTNFCKFILNLPRQAGNNACRGDLGRLPLCNKIWSLSAKYWLRLEQGTDNVFLNNAFACAKNENHKWVQQICCLLKRFGMGHIWSNPTSYTSANIGKSFEQRLNDIYIQTWKRVQSGSSRYKLQYSLQNEYKISPYLHNMVNIETRKIISRLRLDMNCLHECMGRQKRSTDRFCLNCNSTIESVKHFIIECPLYDSQRSQLYRDLVQITNNFQYFSDERK